MVLGSVCLTYGCKEICILAHLFDVQVGVLVPCVRCSNLSFDRSVVSKTDGTVPASVTVVHTLHHLDMTAPYNVALMGWIPHTQREIPR